MTKDSVDACMEALESCLGAKNQFFREGDEVVIVDTSTDPAHVRELEQRLKQILPDDAVHVHHHPELVDDFSEDILEWLGEEALARFVDYRNDALCVNSFSATREVARKYSRNPVIFWIDSDDVLHQEYPGKLRQIIDQGFDEKETRLDALMLEYDYAHAEDGTCITVLKRERVFFRDRYHWKGHCHETAIPRDGIDPPPRQVGYFVDLKAKLVHTAAHAPHEISDIRNYIILRREYEEAQSGLIRLDPRTVLYLANAARGLKRHDEAHALYQMFDDISGSTEDRWNAAYYRASIYLDESVQSPLEAQDMFRKCVEILPKDPRGYLGLARTAAILCRWEESLLWYRFAKSLPWDPQSQVFALDPTHINYHGDLIASNVLEEMGQYEEALKVAHEALQQRPDYEQAKGNFESLKWKGASKALTEAVVGYLRSVPKQGPHAMELARTMVNEYELVPPDLEKMGIGKCEPPEERDPKPSVAFFTGPAPEDWSWKNRESGCGGSEKMIIILAEAIQRTGRANVSVYSSIPLPERGIHNGVNWRHWSEFDRTRERDVLVAWRNAGHAIMPVPAAKRVVWCHDVQNASSYTEEILACVDHINLQSKYHAEPLAGEKFNGKIWIGRNAIELPELTAEDLKEKNAKRVVYFSSPDRGLLTACEIVARAKQQIPDLEFYVCYGFPPWVRKAYAQHNHRFFPDVGHETCTDNYERRLRRALAAVGARVLHRIGFKEMEALVRTSGVWLYPTRFPEISCMAAMEAQAGGAIPVASRYGALAETILPEGNIVPAIEVDDDFGISQSAVETGLRSLLEAVEIPADDERRLSMSAAAAKAFGVDDLAEIWLTQLGL
jgi:glycosyltransferase involved in cell wall biosynthesis